MENNTKTTQPTRQNMAHWNMETAREYNIWREEKLQASHQLQTAESIIIQDLANPSEQEILELSRRCSQTNMALYHAPNAA
ncbi:MAG: hypothetical protein L3J13_07770, partial [Devosiaceae bacterium]|nr:hypothetical protein [Devosiaceae bacterium]